MKILTAVLALLLLASDLQTRPARMAALVAPSAAAQAPEEDLELVGGDPKTIKVAVTIEVDRQVVTKLPFSVRAPAGGIGYGWDWPAGVTVKRKGRVLEIVSAPAGTLTVGASWSVVDFKNDTVSDRFLEKTFHIAVGDAPPPEKPKPLPEPVPPVDDVLGFKALAAAEGNKLPAAAKAKAGALADTFEGRVKATAEGFDFALAELDMKVQQGQFRQGGWGPWLDAWSAHARRMHAEGRLTTVQQLAQAFTDTAFGLRAVR